MPISAQMADGTILEFPDGTDAAVIDRAAQEYVRSAPRGNAGAAPEPVATVPIPASEMPQADVYGERTGNNSMAALRGFGDTMTFNLADNISSAIQAGGFSGPEYEALQAEQAALRAADDPDARTAGEVLGVAGGLFAPAGALGQLTGLGRQAFAGSAMGAGANVLSGIGAARPGEEFNTVQGDAILGGTVGLAAPVVASGARRIIQGAPLPGAAGRAIDQTAADDAVLEAAIDPAALRTRAADFTAATGRSPRISDILTPEEAQRFTKALSRSPDARRRVLETYADDLNALPGEMSGAVQQPAIGPAQAEVYRQTADKANYGPAENAVASITGANRAVLQNDILPYVSLPKATADKTAERFGADQLTGGDLVTIRRALNRFNKDTTNSGKAYEDIVTELDAIIGEVAPRLNVARTISAENRAFIEGSELGRNAAVPGSRSGEIVAEVQNARPLQATGVAPGTRSGLIDQAGNPRQSYALARELETNPAYADQLRASLPAGEADALIAFATQQRRAVDNLASLARIPGDKVDSILDNVEEMTDVIAAAGFGAGGAFKASLINEGFARLGIGRGAADRLADDLLNPARRDRVIELLESRGVPRARTREIVQGAFLSTANSLYNLDRDQ